MNPLPFHTKLLLSGCAFISIVGSAFSDPEPNASEILAASRLNQVTQSANLKAELRDAGGKRSPFVISSDEGVIRYSFQEGPEIALRLSDDSADLTERVDGSESRVRGAKLEQRVKNTPITYEDLALQFLHWPRAKVNGEERIVGQNCWVLEIQAPRGRSQYGVVRVWVDQENGSVMQIRGYNDEGKPVKHFKVLSVQKIDGQWMLKQMRVESLNPETGKPVEMAYLTVKDKVD